MRLTTSADPINEGPEPARHGPVAARAGLLAGLRHGRYPIVPEVLANAVAALDGLEEVERQVLAPVAMTLGRPGAADGLGRFAERVTVAVLAGQSYPTDFAHQAHEARLAHDRLEAGTAATERIRTRLATALPAVVTEALPGLLAGLRTQLVEVLAELLPAVEALGDLDTTDSEAVAGATTAQRKALVALGDLRTRYDRLRLAQRDALSASSLTPPGTTNVTVDHGWREVFASGLHEFADVAHLGTLSPETKGVDRLRLVARRADVWLPDALDLAAAWDDLHEAARGAA